MGKYTVTVSQDQWAEFVVEADSLEEANFEAMSRQNVEWDDAEREIVGIEYDEDEEIEPPGRPVIHVGTKQA